MNGNKASYKELLAGWNAAELSKDVEVVIGVPAPYLQFVRDEMKFGEVASQNCYKAAKGAFTGEITPEMVLDNGATWSIIGHSERRDVFGETDELIAEKTKFCIDNGVKVIVCVGEHKEEREAGTTMTVVSAQLKAITSALSAEDYEKLVIAYEPVWAIGTGLTATPDQAQGTHKDIREWLTANVSEGVANGMRILYGGSVKPANCVELGQQPDVDGFLVGGASLKAELFAPIIASPGKAGAGSEEAAKKQQTEA